jgi:hypothetical protein
VKKRDIRLTTDAHREPFGDFYEAFQDIGHKEGWRPGEILRHFLEAGFRAHRGRLLLGAAFDANEAEYMKLVHSCRHPETMNRLSIMLGALGVALLREPVDFVGPIFSEIAADAGMGQCFTPFELCRLMAKFTFADRASALRDGRKYITVQEPSCGVGGMILACNLELREAGYDIAREVHWLAVDVDSRAIHAAYLQAVYTDCSGIFIHGNTLTLEQRSATPTPAAVAFPKSFTANAAPPAPKPEPRGQLEMF